MDTELQDKHYQLQKIQKEMRSIVINTVIHQVEVAIRSRLAAIKKRHEKKLFNLRQQNVNISDSAVVTNQLIRNFPSYNLSCEEELAPCYGLDQQ